MTAIKPAKEKKKKKERKKDIERKKEGRTRPIAISRVLSHLPTVTLAYYDTCLL